MIRSYFRSVSRVLPFLVALVMLSG
ncbi:MAG TPA: LemA family protein, partial [Chlorobaculum parvum]|nr:LemA family protein [Chlorobaculum parvum]